MTAALTERTALYRLFNAAGTLLYIGISVNPDVRWRVHAREKSWWAEVSERTVEWFETRKAAEAAEVAAVAAELPGYNVEHSLTRRRGDAKDEYRSPYDKPRQIRIATQKWRDFGLATKAAGTTRAAVLGQFIRWYISEPGSELPIRPAVDAWSRGQS